MNIHTYIGKTIYVGIDVHKKSYSVSVVCDKNLVKRATFKADPKELRSFLFNNFKGATIKSAYEAGFSGFVLHRFLVESGIDNIVVNAASIEVGARDRVKTDKRDSLKIATQLAAGRLTGIFVPDEEMEDRRELSRIRSTLVKDRGRVGTRLKMKANQFGLIGADDNQKVCQKWIDKLLSKNMRPYLRRALESLANQWRFLSDEIRDVEQELREQAKEDPELEELFISCPGVGKTAARILANELGDMHQFKSNKALYSYIGLTPCEYSSGEHVRKGHITRQGKSLLRHILNQVAWKAIKIDKSLEEIYERIKAKRGAKRAIVAVSRRLVGRLRSCSMKGELYQCNYGT